MNNNKKVVGYRLLTTTFIFAQRIKHNAKRIFSVLCVPYLAFSVLLLTLLLSTTAAQMKIVGKNADGTLQSTTPYTSDASAVLELESTNKGFLLPRLTTTQRNAMVSPSRGLMVFDITNNCLYYYNETWMPLCSSYSNINAFIDPGNCSTSLTDTRDGQTSTYTCKYYGALAGCWMTQNLRYFAPQGGMRINPGRNDGLSIPLIPNNAANVHSISPSDSIKYFQGKDTTVSMDAFTSKFGLLYRWDSAMLGSITPGVQGICPEGWHIPTDAEWNILEQVIANDNSLGGTSGSWQIAWETYLGTGNASRPAGVNTGHGRLMKNDSLIYGQSGGSTYKWSGTTADGGVPSITTINASSFNGVPSGGIFTGYVNREFGQTSVWWSSSVNSSSAYIHYLINGSTGVNRWSMPKSGSFYSVRCKKN